MKPNRLAQATQELSNLNLNGFVIPTDYPPEGMDKYYICVGIKSSDSVDKMSKIHKARTVSASINQWSKMQRQVKQGFVKKIFVGMYDKIVILHDPTIKEQPKKNLVKGLSPTHKSKVKELAAAGVGALEIASELEIKVERVEAYLNK